MKAVLFDLDGTLLPMNEDNFLRGYFGYLYKHMAPFGFEKDSFVKAVWAGTDAMRKNDGKTTCMEAFWKTFKACYPDKNIDEICKEFGVFYSTEFENTKAFCEPAYEGAQQIINEIKKRVGKVIVVANPVFPKNAMEARIRFAGIDPKSFDYITSYEESHFAKPNKNFIKEVLEKFNLKADEVVYFGNSEKEDGKVARDLNLKFFLTGNIVRDENNKEPFNEISFEDIVKTL